MFNDIKTILSCISKKTYICSRSLASKRTSYKYLWKCYRTEAVIMKFEYTLYILVPVVIGYIIERYKDMSTLKAGLLVFFTFFLVKVVFILVYGGSFINDVSEALILRSIIIMCMILFYFQKWIRRTKKN